jgi:AbrB family looped-hinge helix DNA binding protein
MAALSTAKMSAKGQVVIPEAVRKRLGLGPGSQFLVVAEGDAVILKTITPASLEDFDSVVRRARRQAKAAGMKRSDVAEAVAKVRGRP